MSNQAIATHDDTASSELHSVLNSWRRHLTAQRWSPATLDRYSSSVRGLDRFLAAAAVPRSRAELQWEQIEPLITDVLEHRTPATAQHGDRTLRSFFGWLVAEGEIAGEPD